MTENDIQPKRIPFWLQEAVYMDQHDPRKPGAQESYADIARHLNQTWPELNKGQRTKWSVIGYYREQDRRKEMRVRMITLPKELSDTLSLMDIQRIVVSHADPIGAKRG